MMKSILFIGSTRYKKIIIPLSNHYNIKVLKRKKYNFLALYNEVKKNIFSMKPDIILSDDYQGIAPVVVGYIAHLNKIPFIIRPRGAFWYRLHDRYEDSPISIFFKIYFWFTRRLSFKYASGVLPVSNFLRDQVIDHFDIHPDNIITVNSAVDQNRFRPVCEEEKENKISIITGFNFKKKYEALDYFAAGFVKILIKFPDLKIFVFGGGHSHKLFKERIMRELGDINIQSRFKIVGEVENVENALRRSKILVHLAFRETYPNVVLEAMASSVPVVVNRYAGNNEALSKSKETAGIIIDSINEFVDALSILLDSNNLRQKMGTAGRKHVEHHNSYDTVGKEFFKAINHIVNSTKDKS
jgi:glycosyltransferase involved in cell wall biosynthesis